MIIVNLLEGAGVFGGVTAAAHVVTRWLERHVHPTPDSQTATEAQRISTVLTYYVVSDYFPEDAGDAAEKLAGLNRSEFSVLTRSVQRLADDATRIADERARMKDSGDAAGAVPSLPATVPVRELHVHADTNENWIREIVNDHYDGRFSATEEAMISRLATEVTSLLAEAYEQGRRDAEVDAQIENRG